MKKLLIVIGIIIIAKWWFKDPSISVQSQIDGVDVSYNYIVRYSGGKSSGTLPMLIVLHGNSDTTENFFKTALDTYSTPARIILIQAPISYRSGNSWPRASSVIPYGDTLNLVVEKIRIKYPTNGKPVLLGFSGGGTMAYYQAVQHSDDYSYIFPVSGNLSKQDLGNQIGHDQPSAGIHAFHGENDQVVSFSGGKSAVKLLKSQGASIRFTPFNGGHQGIFREMKPVITRAVEERLETLFYVDR